MQRREEKRALDPVHRPRTLHKRPLQRIERRILLAQAHVDVGQVIGRDVSLRRHLLQLPQHRAGVGHASDLGERLPELRQEQRVPGVERHRSFQLSQAFGMPSHLQVGPPQRRVTPRSAGVELDDARGRMRRFLVPPRPQQRRGDIGPVRQRVELLRPFHHRDRLIVTPQRRAHPAVVVVRVGTAGTQLEGQSKLLFGTRPIEVAHELEQAEHGVHLAQSAVECERFGHGRLGPLVGHRRLDRTAPGIDAQMGPGQREAGVRQRVLWIACDCLLEVLDALADAFHGVAAEPVPSLKVELVGLEIARRLSLDPGALVGRQLGPERGGDLDCHVRLDREDVGQLAIVGLRPEVLIRLGVDELRHDAHAIAGPPHAPLEQRRHLQRRRDLPQTVLPLLERHH